MTINQILDEQMKKVEEYISIYPDGEESFEEVDIEPEEFRSFFHSYTRKLIESLAEEICPEWIDNPYGEVSSYTVGRRDERKEIRLKVKEILSNLK